MTALEEFQPTSRVIELDASIIPYDPILYRLCSISYNNHPRGCPYFCDCAKKGKKVLDKFFDVDKDFLLVVVEYPLGLHAEFLRQKHKGKKTWRERTYPDIPKKSVELVDKIMDELRERHPDWPENHFPKRPKEEWTSAREWYNLIRWQGKVRSLREEITDKLTEKYGLVAVSPDFCAINTTGLMANIGLKPNWVNPPRHEEYKETVTYSLKLLGHKL